MESLDTDVPYNKSADVGSAAVDDGVVGYLDALGPAGIVAVVVVICLVVAEGDGSGREDGFDGHIGDIALVTMRVDPVRRRCDGAGGHDWRDGIFLVAVVDADGRLIVQRRLRGVELLDGR